MPGHEGLQFSFIPYSLLFGEELPSEFRPQSEDAGKKVTCELCGFPLAGEPPVLLESGRCVHLECYLNASKDKQ